MTIIGVTIGNSLSITSFLGPCGSIVLFAILFGLVLNTETLGEWEKYHKE